MAHRKEKVSALERALRDKAQWHFNAEGNSDEEYKKWEHFLVHKAYSDGADLVHARDAQLWKLLEEFEIDAALQNDEENSQYYDCAKRLRALLEAQDAP